MKKFAYIAISLALTTMLFTGCTNKSNKQGTTIVTFNEQENNSEMNYRVIDTDEFWSVLEINGFSKENDHTDIGQEHIDQSGYKNETVYYYDDDNVEIALITLENNEDAEGIYTSTKQSYDKDYPVNSEDTDGDVLIWQGRSPKNKTICRMYKIENQLLIAGGPRKYKNDINNVIEDFYAEEVSEDDEQIESIEPTDSVEPTDEVEETTTDDNDAEQEIENAVDNQEDEGDTTEYIHPTKEYYEIYMDGTDDIFKYIPNPHWRYDEKPSEDSIGKVWGYDENGIMFVYGGYAVKVSEGLDGVLADVAECDENNIKDSLETFEVNGKDVYAFSWQDEDGYYRNSIIQDLGHEYYLFIGLSSNTPYSAKAMVNRFAIQLDNAQ